MTRPAPIHAHPSAAPAADPHADRRRELRRQTSAWLISIAFHAGLLALLAMITWAAVREPEPDILVQLGGGGGGSGSGADRGVGTGGQRVAPRPADGLAGELSDPVAPPIPIPAPPPLPAPSLAPAALAIQDLSQPDAAAQAALSNAGFDPALAVFTGPAALGAPGRGGPGSGGGRGAAAGPGTGDFDGPGSGLGGVIDDMRNCGLDVVFVLDATDSMAPYIGQAKTRLRQIVSLVTQLVGKPARFSRVPNVRFGLVAFKDYGDDYGVRATRSLPLTGDLDPLQAAMDAIIAGGGADVPEPIHDALRAAADPRSMGWNRSRKNVIVLVTDAPVHSLGREEAYRLARQFAKNLNGQINVIDVGGVADGHRIRETALPDCQRIAAEGNGSAFLLEDDAAFWRHLIVSIFGQRYQRDVQQLVDKYVKDN